ncbi:MAG: hypothetical protein CL940_02785 [Deltaproteobacteria bacterium]|nr:hypothetical protein [Deltaproteobacteria bacterium]
MSHLSPVHRPLIPLLLVTLLAVTACTEPASDSSTDEDASVSPSDAATPEDTQTLDIGADGVIPDADAGPNPDGSDGGADDASASDAGDDGAIEDGGTDSGVADTGSTDGGESDTSIEDATAGDIEDSGSAETDAVDDAAAEDAETQAGCTTDEDCEGQNSCWEATCDQDTSTCVETQLAEGQACDDGNACSTGDACTADGWCLGLQAVTCSDDNPCTDDLCSPTTGCEFKNNFASCDDGDPCTVGEQCGGGVCAGAVALCDDDNPCTQDTCDDQGACDFVPDDAGLCDDGSACTEGDACVAGTCIPGPIDACDDDNPCTDDACVAGACSSVVLDGAGCDDGDACTDGDLCAEDVCVPGSPVICEDDNICTANACDAAAGCTTTILQGESCEDDNACSTESQCNAAAQCVTTEELVCDDDNSCTENNCSSATGCFFTATLNSCDDGDVCTSQDTCQADGSCVGALQDCDDDNACTTDTCDTEAGCLHEDTTAECDLGNPCMVYGCSTLTGCTEQAHTDACDDDDVCTGSDLCVEGACVGTAIPCDDDDPCTADSCDPTDGCQHVAQDTPCDDGDACTENEACEVTDPFCNGGSPVAQDDDVECTVDACDPELGVTHTPDVGLCEVGLACDAEVGCVVGTPILVISKYSLAPTDPVAGGQGQWIAVTNVGNAAIDLTELYLLNSVSAMALIEAPSGVASDPVLVGPGETVAGLKEPSGAPPVAPEPFDFFFASAEDVNYGWDPEEDQIRLVDGGFNTVDSVSVKGVGFGPLNFTNQSPVVVGYATELDQSALAEATSQNDNNSALLWCVYDETGATPASPAPDCDRARINEVALAEADGERFVELHLPYGGHTGDLKLRLLDVDGAPLLTLLIDDTRMPVKETLVYTDGVAGVNLNAMEGGAVALLRGDELLDIYGFGALVAQTDSVVGHPMFEGTAGPAQVAGQSAARIADGLDTDDNSADFEGATPSPGELNAL